MLNVRIKKVFFVLLILIQTCILYGAWFESENINIGNLRYPMGAQKEFVKIPNSPFVLFFSEDGENAAVLDINSVRFKDNIYTNNRIYNPIIFPHPDSGWNIYFHSEFNFYSRQIESLGEFSEDIVSLGTYQGMFIVSVGAPEKGLAFFAADKLYRINSQDNEFSAFPFPEGWDPNILNMKIFLTEDQNDLFIVTKSESTKDYQVAMFNIATENFRLITAEANFFKDAVDITNWISNNGKYLILKKDSLWVFDAESGNFQVHSQGLPPGMKNILEDKSGKFIYLLETSALDILNLNDKTLEKHPLTIEEGWAMDIASAIYDYDEKWIITDVYKGGIGLREFAPCVISVNDKSFSFFPDLTIRISFEFCYMAKENKLAANGLEDPTVGILNLANHEVKKTIPFLYDANDWSVMKGDEFPELIANNSGTEFCQLKVPYRRVLNDTGIKATMISQFPDKKSALIVENDLRVSEKQRLKEYIFYSNSSNDIELPYDIQDIYADPNNNQIIGIKNGIVQIIQHGGNVQTWQPADYDSLKSEYHLFDTDNSILWMIYDNQSTQKYIFNRVSAQTKELIDTLNIDEGAIGYFIKIEADLDQRYLYIIDGTENGTRRLLVIDIQKKEIIKQITLQENVTFDSGNIKVVPGIIPIPEKERLFLWAHDSKWCIDTNSMELLYGDVQQNPQTLEGQNLGIKGYWNKKREKVIVVDSGYTGFYQTGSVYEVNLKTGEALSNIDIPDIDELKSVFFPKDQEKIEFLNDKSASVLTLYLNPAWETTATITPSTNYVQFGEGDEARFRVNVKNPFNFEQRATAYIWMVAPDGTMLFFGPTGLTFDVAGIPLTLPANCDVTGDILSFTMPSGVPEGFYNYNAVFINERGDRGPIGTWNFYVRD